MIHPQLLSLPDSKVITMEMLQYTTHSDPRNPTALALGAGGMWKQRTHPRFPKTPAGFHFCICVCSVLA